jgi:hypothetical protein
MTKRPADDFNDELHQLVESKSPEIQDAMLVYSSTALGTQLDWETVKSEVSSMLEKGWTVEQIESATIECTLRHVRAKRENPTVKQLAFLKARNCDTKHVTSKSHASRLVEGFIRLEDATRNILRGGDASKNGENGAPSPFAENANDARSPAPVANVVDADGDAGASPLAVVNGVKTRRK